MTRLPCRLGGFVTLTVGVTGRCFIGHTSGPATVEMPSEPTAWAIVAALAEAATHGEADAYAFGLLSQGMTDFDRFWADPENQPSPGGIAALRKMFRLTG
jgi:hypothetical protein